MSDGQLVGDLLVSGVDIRRDLGGEWYWGIDWGHGNLFDHLYGLSDLFYVQWRGWRESVVVWDVRERIVVDLVSELRARLHVKVLKWSNDERVRLNAALLDLDMLESALG